MIIVRQLLALIQADRRQTPIYQEPSLPIHTEEDERQFAYHRPNVTYILWPMHKSPTHEEALSAKRSAATIYVSGLRNKVKWVTDLLEQWSC